LRKVPFEEVIPVAETSTRSDQSFDDHKRMSATGVTSSLPHRADRLNLFYCKADAKAVAREQPWQRKCLQYNDLRTPFGG
jgi:hypothetical protein